MSEQCLKRHHVFIFWVKQSREFLNHFTLIPQNICHMLSWHTMPEDLNLHQHRCEKLKSLRIARSWKTYWEINLNVFLQCDLRNVGPAASCMWCFDILKYVVHLPHVHQTGTCHINTSSRLYQYIQIKFTILPRN
jgi:hypothetical protein